MIKKTFIVLGIVAGTILLLGAIGVYYFKPNENFVLNFIKDNPEKSAIKLYRNDTLLVDKSPDKMMPLASTVKIIIAIEYAKQASSGMINPDEKISIKELDKFYIPNTDGGAHKKWLDKVSDKIENDEISIREIAKGMIAFSSNANTEWLSDKLGLENINNRLDSLGIKKHSEIYYIVSALFVGKEKFPDSDNKDLESKLKALPIDEYIQTTNVIHEKLKKDSTYKKDKGDLSMNIQRIWSDNLPESTVEEYVGVMKKINSRTYFNHQTQQYLDEVMEFLLDNPANRQWLEHSGMKGGSTAFVLTKALYATDKKGNKTEMAYFLNDLEFLENTRLQMSMNQFELKILTDKEFRSEVEKELKK
ncbi:serine hydrolase [Mangrovivirga sp. M17]|uniref:beta-lactamase n=1 Tax=Mangrovivirga halotolerans TaxID=2993936 RepID=A0ABT3RWE1_9BACT|nr:serine hydrolase [Mangrovivirga halotolerans]MCX2745480.1 serine hydrolase [Mangrovivirga halotolerans]